jgi:hypothetical protein
MARKARKRREMSNRIRPGRYPKKRAGTNPALRIAFDLTPYWMSVVVLCLKLAPYADWIVPPVASGIAPL